MTEHEEKQKQPVVSVYNEWDPLEEVIVGVVDGAAVPQWDVTLESTMPDKFRDYIKSNAGKSFPKEQLDAAQKDLETFVGILESEGVTVRRPESLDYTKAYSTPEWNSPGGLYAAMPRDTLFSIGNEIIEVPMAWKSRYFESFAFRKILKDYFRRGAKWTAAPKPELTDDIYNKDYKETDNLAEMNYAITEFEPTFDAADFIRCGRDIFGQKSHVTNEFGIEWLRRHLGGDYQVHAIEVNDTHPMHIDASLMPLAPGKVLVNKERVPVLPPQFKTWDVMYAPEPCIPKSHPLYMTSAWINMNILSLDHERVIVEENEETIIKAFKDFGMKPIPCPFYHFNTFGGSFHCATLDVRRTGKLESYF